jgi:hypothetical protein
MDDDMVDCVGFGSSSHTQRVGSFVSMAGMTRSKTSSSFRLDLGFIFIFKIRFRILLDQTEPKWLF